MRPSPLPDYVDLDAIEFAELLSLTAEDAPHLTTATIRLPAVWVSEWQARTGSRELTIPDLCVILGVSERTAFRYFSEQSNPRLKHRIASVAGRRGRVVSPANLVLFLRERNRMAGADPKVTETPGQRLRRGKDAKARLAELCGGN
jgi:hypothetical protein